VCVDVFDVSGGELAVCEKLVGCTVWGAVEVAAYDCLGEVGA